MQSSRPANRLSRETSPYLLQHAHNPVDWRPWGEEAFAEARRRNVPIFLSIGYSTCYWCHVMEREVFEHEGLARQMNELFVNIKVDREERPDVDDIYMAATQLLSGRGGWPMSCFLEPGSLKPFWCGTYFPAEAKMGMPGFGQILEALSTAWRDRPREVLEQAEEVAEGVRQHMPAMEAPVALSAEQVSDGAKSLLQMLDRVHGGFGRAPKFPQPVYCEFLLDVRERAGDEATRAAIDQAVRLTLDRMAMGGMNDQVGGGFHRYSVDEKWLVPHFEKMLYDNAQLGSLYARAAAIYRDSYYEQTARGTLGYVLAEMTSPDGAFYSAQDAEVGGREGANYIWQPGEIRAALSAEDAQFALDVYGLNDGPNFQDPHHPEEAPANILFLRERPEAMASGRGMDAAAFKERLGKINCALYGVRARRPQPRLDDKTITSWNGLMIGALARAAVWLKEPRYAGAAARAADAVLDRMRDGEGRLLRTYRGGMAKTGGFLEDYAFLADGLIALSQAKHLLGDRRRDDLHEAQTLLYRAEELFGDPLSGGYLDVQGGQEDLFVRPRSIHDGAMPSGSSMMLRNWLECCDGSGSDPALERALATLRSFSAPIARSPLSMANGLRGLLSMLSSSRATAERIAALGPAAPDAVGEGAEFTPVEIYADTERITVGPGQPARFRLVLRIAEGFHINAADPGEETGLVPLRVGIVGGTGVIAYADYPQGEAFGPDGKLRVHTGSVEFDVAVERSGAIAGRPLLSVTFQACTERECLPPMTAELDVAIDPAG